MADPESHSSTNILKNSKILVNVDEALPDIIIVTYTFESKIFQGALLDTTNRTLPNGIVCPLGALTPQPTEGQEEDKLFSVSQRFTYFQDKPIKSVEQQNVNQFLMKRQIRPPARYRTANVRATPVRLRPRQVLCSKCRGICNENSENVDLSQKRKCPDTINIPASNKTERLVTTSNDLVSNKSPRPLFSENHRDNQPKSVSPTKDVKMSPTLIPRLARLQPAEISSALIGKTNKLNIVGNYWVSPSRLTEDSEINGDENEENDEKLYCMPVHKVLVNDTFDDTSTSMVDPLGEDETLPSDRMVLRKKKSVGSMEDLWDESVFEECAKTVKIARTTPVIKISFGSQGEGTVMKIPSKIHHCSENEDLSARAAKKALKRAKREARRKMLAGASPRYLGNMSPGTGGASPAHEELERRRRKRNKVKHKKKHKEERKHKESEDSNCNKCFDEPSYNDMKELCLKQKLSISLKRVNTSAYKACDESGSKSPTSSEMSDDHFETVPDFPSPSTLDIRETVDSCVTSDGRVMVVGNVVWGKIHGFPWWPGKVSCITASRTDDGQTTDNEAHVRWYGSSTMSVMSCEQLSPFLETFKMRYNKKKRGPYKEAIRQATFEAQKEEEQREEVLREEARQLASPVHSSESPAMIIDVVA